MIPILLKEFREMIDAAYAIHEVNEAKLALESQHPDKVLVATMRTPDGRIMDVHRVSAAGAMIFVAEGSVGGLRCTIIGHVSTLNLFFAFEEPKGRSRAGFVIEVPERATEPRIEPS